MCERCAAKLGTESMTLLNGVFVPATDRAEAGHKLGLLHLIEDGRFGIHSGPTWELCGYVHGHIQEIADVWHEDIKKAGIMDEDGEIPVRLQWALVSLCCQGERLGQYAWSKARY